MREKPGNPNTRPPTTTPPVVQTSLDNQVTSSFVDSTQSSYSDQGSIPSYTSGVNGQTPFGGQAYDTCSHMIHACNFDMWVSAPQQPNRIDKALHIYTRLQGDQRSPVALPMPLDSLKGWRASFPYLASLVDDVNSQVDCDIILLEVNLQLMDDFPPSGSRLGIQLDFDFSHPTAGDISMVGQMESWTCDTRIYENGKVLLEAHHDLPKTTSTKVKPLFESSWWAKLFTQLTQEKQAAEKSGQSDAAKAAEENTRQFFRSLSAMQELKASLPAHRRMPDGINGNSTDSKKRMAILLWKFRQTRPGEVGTTTWRRLIPPSTRNGTNNERGLDLPPLVIDNHMLSARPQHQVYGNLTQNGMMQLPTPVTPQQQWPMYPLPNDQVTNMYSPHGTYDFLNGISRPEEVLKIPSTSVLDSFNPLPHDSSQPGSIAVSSPSPALFNVHDLTLTHGFHGLPLPTYGLTGHTNHYLPAPHVLDNNQTVLNSIYGTTAPSMTDVTQAPTPMWTTQGSTIRPELAGANYTHLPYPATGQHHQVVPVSREQQNNELEGVLSADDLMDKLVGAVPPEAQLNGTGSGNARYTESTAVEAV